MRPKILKVKSQREAFGLELRWWLGGYYPPFVYSPRAAGSPGGVPVFIFHSVSPGTFEEQLAFLSSNGYYTPSRQEFHEYILGESPLPARSAFLTFDDGGRTLFDCAYPLLKKYGMRAVCFVCPGLIGGEAESGGGPFCSWEEITGMEKSGAVGFESHTMFHERIFTGDKIVDFVNPASFGETLGLSVPAVFAGGRRVRLREPGSPLYETGSRMGERPAYLDDETLRRKCSDFVSRKGGASFFARPGWRRELYKFAEKSAGGRTGGRFESPAERNNGILRSLLDSRIQLEERLGRRVSHLAYPWGYGSRTAVELSRRAGYEANFWGPLPSARLARPGINPFYIPRLKEDYIFRLPGQGRKPLSEIFRRKTARRASAGDIY